MNYTATNDHVPEAERNNWTIQERMRVQFHRLPYKCMPRIMWKTLAYIVTGQLNWFPAKGGVSPYYSPHMILNRASLDYKKHCQVPFGAFVSGIKENTPSNTPMEK